jgi:hypothetical protein
MEETTRMSRKMNMFWVRIKDALVAAGLPREVRLYDCRHTAASLLYAQGGPELQIAAILAHMDPAFTLRTYTYVFKRSRREAADKNGRRVGKRSVNFQVHEASAQRCRLCPSMPPAASSTHASDRAPRQRLGNWRAWEANAVPGCSTD